MQSKIIIDVDTGIDDALAILVAYKNLRKNILGITTCGGNVRIEDSVANTQRVTQLANWEVPIFTGATKTTSGTEFVHAYDYHGDNGICNVELPLKEVVPSNKGAVQFIEESIEQYSGEIVFFCLAAPTNLALALQNNPSLAKKITAVYLMGGALNVRGNASEFAEHNFFQDPVAVLSVLENIEDVYIVPLDITNECIISDKEIESLNPKTDKERFVKEAVLNWYRFFGYPNQRAFELYDPLTIAVYSTAFVDFKSEKVDIRTNGVQRGQIFLSGDFPVQIASAVNVPEFKNYFYQSLQ